MMLHVTPEAPKTVQVYFDLELCSAEWLADYLEKTPTTLSELVRMAVLKGIRHFKAQRRLVEIEETIAALHKEREEVERESYN